MPMQLETEHGKIFSTIFGIAKLFYKDVNITFDKSGMHIKQIDPSSVLLTTLNIKAEEVNLKTDRTYVVKIDVRNALNYLKNVEKDDATVLELRNKRGAEPEAMWLVIRDGERAGSALNFRIPFSGKAHVVKFPPDADNWHYTVTMPTKVFLKKLGAIETIHDSVCIRMSPTRLTFSARSIKGDGEVSFVFAKASPATRKGDSDTKEANAPVYLVRHNSKTIESNFKLKQLLNLAKGGNLSETVTLSMSHRSPLRIFYAIKDIGSIAFLLGSQDEAQDPYDEDMLPPASAAEGAATQHESASWGNVDELDAYAL